MCVCACVRACVRAGVRAFVHSCVRAREREWEYGFSLDTVHDFVFRLVENIMP